MPAWHKNLRIIAIFRICYSMIFAISVITLYWKKYGLDLLDFFWLQAIFALAIVLFEIPTGYIGDYLGRKRTLLLSCSVVIVAWVIYAAANSFGSFALAEVILGLGFSFFSGTDTALVYESLNELKQTDQFTLIEGRQLGARHATEALSALLGGFLAMLCPIEYLLLASAAAMGIGFFVCLGLIEPKHQPYQHPKGTWYGLYKIGRYVFLRSRLVRWAVPLLAACSLSTMLGVWLYQPLWETKHVPVWLFGVLWAALALPASLASHFASVVEKYFGQKNVLWLLPIPAVLGYFLVALVPGWWAILFIYLVPVLRGLSLPILSKYIHEETFSDKRATVMSIQSWLFRLAYFIFGPAVGWIGKHYDLSTAFLASSLIALISILAFIPGLARRVH